MLLIKNIKNDLKKKILGSLINLDFVVSATIVGSFLEKKDINAISDIDIIVIVDKLYKRKFDMIINNLSGIEQFIKNKYKFGLIINKTFGPLKFNTKDNVVFHVMIYDVIGHKEHCIKSPFTCLGWQTSKVYIKKPLTKIWKVNILQPNHFFDARRSIDEYMKDIESNSISYREYIFEENTIKETVKSKLMDDKDRYEFTYHIMKFCMSNFLKIYRQENVEYKINKTIKEYSRIFPLNMVEHKKFLDHIKEMKKSNEYWIYSEEDKINLKSFLDDFQKQFNDMFDKNASRIYFMRHQKTPANIDGLFLGKISDPDIINPDKKEINKLNNFLKEKEIDSAYSSPYKRCIQTFYVMDYIKDVNPIIIDELKEIDYGIADGKDINYLRSKYPRLINEWKNRKDPRFPNGENQRDVKKRLKRFLYLLKSENKSEKINRLVITHNVVIRCLLGDMYNVPMNNWFKIKINHIEPIEIILTKNGNFYPNLSPEQFIYMFDNVSFGD